jgi:opacity protein-like surface antigen
MRGTKALLLAGATFAFTSAALAADLPVKAPVIPQAVYNWTGFYAGVNAGYGGGMKDWSGINAVAGGGLAGVQFGFNQQVGNLVFGLEGDASWSDMKGSRFETIAIPFSVSSFSATIASNIHSVETLAGRVGVAADRWLVFGKLGLAWADETHTQDQLSLITGVPGAQIVHISGSEFRQGWMAGMGAEYALLGHWSVKAEYDYLDFTSVQGLIQRGTLVSFAGVTSAVAIPEPGIKILERLHLAKVGLNYRFGPDRAPDIAPVRTTRGYDWTGVYAGVEGAGGWGQNHFIGFDPWSGYDVKGGLGGGLIGVRVQPSDLVVGAEAEYMGGRIDGGRTDVIAATANGTATQTLASRFDQIGMATMQAGFVTMDRLLVYAKGGLAMAHANHTNNFSFIGAPGITSTINMNNGDVWHTAGVAGAGGEYAFMGNWSAKLEYDYLRFRDQDVFMPGTITQISPVLGTGTTSLPTSATMRTYMHLFKFGINYRFGPDVIRAKY